jgi:hypothetical protein
MIVVVFDTILIPIFSVDLSPKGRASSEAQRRVGAACLRSNRFSARGYAALKTEFRVPVVIFFKKTSTVNDGISYIVSRRELQVTK